MLSSQLPLTWMCPACSMAQVSSAGVMQARCRNPTCGTVVILTIIAPPNIAEAELAEDVPGPPSDG